MRRTVGVSIESTNATQRQRGREQRGRVTDGAPTTEEEEKIQLAMALSASSTLLQQESQDMAMAMSASLLGREVDLAATTFVDSYQQELERRRVLQEQQDRDRRREEEARRRVLQEQQDRDRKREEETRRERALLLGNNNYVETCRNWNNNYCCRDCGDCGARCAERFG